MCIRKIRRLYAGPGESRLKGGSVCGVSRPHSNMADIGMRRVFVPGTHAESPRAFIILFSPSAAAASIPPAPVRTGSRYHRPVTGRPRSSPRGNRDRSGGGDRRRRPTEERRRRREQPLREGGRIWGGRKNSTGLGSSPPRSNLRRRIIGDDDVL